MEQNTDRREAIACLNDTFRASFIGGGVFLTKGVAALNLASQACLMTAVKIAKPKVENDPWGEHDLGSLDHQGDRYFWKIDYYALDNETLSPDPSNPAVTRRILTVMRADEYYRRELVDVHRPPVRVFWRCGILVLLWMKRHARRSKNLPSW
jgi:hypothetical protein